jgi:hypothetical protein
VTLVHQHPQYDSLLSIVADRLHVPVALVEKDYWVTHTLWSLTQSGLHVYFKGGTCLSKGFGLIERFSEDLDVKLEAPDLPRVENWKSDGTTAMRARQKYFEALVERLHVPGAEVTESVSLRDPQWRSAVFLVRYRGRFTGALPESVRPFVQLEVGSARVTPGVEKSISSWVHEYLIGLPAIWADMMDNRALAIHCVLPAVTLLEKIEAIGRRFTKPDYEPGTFVRHYEDAARILESGVTAEHLRTLLSDMHETGDIRAWPDRTHAAFTPNSDTQWQQLEAAWRAIAPLFWGSRRSLSDCAHAIRDVLQQL